MANIFVVLVRSCCFSSTKESEDYVHILSREEAIKNGWIDSDGERVWVVPPKNEYSHTFVWGFKDENNAIAFYENLTSKELGIKVNAM